MTKNELISKVSEELKVQGVNATDEQIESALKQIASKQELTEDALDNVAGGAWWEYLIPGYRVYAGVRDIVNVVKGDNKPTENGGDSNGGGNSGGNDDGGKINVTQPNNNEKSNQLTNVTGPNTQNTNNFTFN